MILLFLTDQAPPPRRGPDDSCLLCWPQAFKELLRLPFSLTPLPYGRKRLQRYNLFSNRQAFFHFFFKNFCLRWISARYKSNITEKKRLKTRRDGACTVSTRVNLMSKTDYSAVMSTTGASGAFFITEATPLSMFFSLTYIWLEPMI